MSASVRFTYNIEATDKSGATTCVHKDSVSVTIATDGPTTIPVTLTSGQTVVVYDPTNDGLGVFSAFSALVVVALTGNIELELTCNEGDANETVFSVKVVPGVPFILGSNYGRYGAVGAQGIDGTADVIDKIR